MGSTVIDCQKMRKNADVVSYLTNYMTKPPELEKLDSDEIAHDWYRIVSATRMLIVFGKRVPMPPKPTKDPTDAKENWTTVGKLSELYFSARSGNRLAASILGLMGLTRDLNLTAVGTAACTDQSQRQKDNADYTPK